MGWIVKYHLGSCQYITKYLETKWTVGKDKCALKGKVRHDGLFFTLHSACCSSEEGFPLYRRVLFFLFVPSSDDKNITNRMLFTCLLCFIENKAILFLPYGLSVDFSETMEINCIQD